MKNTKIDMKLVGTKVTYLPQEKGIEGIYKQIELCGRTCYKSEDKITETSAEPFVERMIASKHTAMLEHGTVYLFVPKDEVDFLPLHKYMGHKYSHAVDVLGEEQEFEKGLYITTNYRVLVENNWLDDLKYLCDPTELHWKRYTFVCTTSIGVTREGNRHRVNSIAEQSTRYCNYSNEEKFEGGVAFCKPSWINEEELSAIGEFKRVNRKKNPSPTELWITALLNAEECYIALIKQGWQPQQAREVLPLCTATEIVYTAFAPDWRFFFDLRLEGKTGNPHPNMKLLADLLQKEAEEKGILKDIMSYPSRFI